jgi:hypothetical protein
MSACIVPDAPQFQDPPDPPQSVPYISSATPALGSFVPIPSGKAHFAVQVTDPDTTVTLHYRWVFDYPPFSSTTRPIPESTMPTSVNGTPFAFDLGCLTINPASGSNSSVNFELIVADRQFLEQPPPGTDPNHILDLTDPAGGHVVIASWSVLMPCPVSQ